MPSVHSTLRHRHLCTYNTSDSESPSSSEPWNLEAAVKKSLRKVKRLAEAGEAREHERAWREAAAFELQALRGQLNTAATAQREVLQRIELTLESQHSNEPARDSAPVRLRVCALCLRTSIKGQIRYARSDPRYTPRFKRCPCLKVYYCDPTCQMQDWADHKHVCDYIDHRLSDPLLMMAGDYPARDPQGRRWPSNTIHVVWQQ